MPTYQGGRVKWTWKHKALATLDQDPPVANTWYTVLDTTTGGVMLQVIQARQINDEAAAKAIGVRITIDGRTITGETSLTNNTEYWTALSAFIIDSLGLSTTQNSILKPGYLYGESVKVEIRQTTAVGTNQKLDGRVLYAALEAI